MKIITIYGFDTCSYFYKACIYAAILKKHKLCSEYEIKSFPSRQEYHDSLRTLCQLNSFEHNTSPLVVDSDGTYIGGCDSLQDILQQNDIFYNEGIR